MSKEDAKAKAMPKGGRLGGSVFPRVNLKKAIEYATKLVSKTQTGRQSYETVLVGVLGNKGSAGRVRLSALRQYGFVDGDQKSGFEASQPAKDLIAATPEELREHRRAAALKPKIFREIFTTFHGDPVTRAKIRQRALQLDVHPEIVDSCVETYIESLALAELVALEGDDVKHVAAAEVHTTKPPSADHQNDVSGEPSELQGEEEGTSSPLGKDESPPDQPVDPLARSATLGPRAVFQINVSLDASLDTEKLEKQLALLKRYGAL